MSDQYSVDDIAAMREQGDLLGFLQSLTGRAPKPKPTLTAVPAPAYRITHPGGWPLGTAATGPTPPPDQCSCAKCRKPASPNTGSGQTAA